MTEPGGISSGVKVLGTCHFEKKIGAISPCYYLKNGTHSSVSLTRNMQSHKLKRRIAVDKDARFITSSQNFFLPIIPCTFQLC